MSSLIAGELDVIQLSIASCHMVKGKQVKPDGGVLHTLHPPDHHLRRQVGESGREDGIKVSCLLLCRPTINVFSHR